MKRRRGNGIVIALVLMLLAVAGPTQALEQPLPNPAQEARAVALFGGLRCVVCQSESIADSQADMARDMRQLVRDKIRNGWSDTQIRDYIRARYGDFILLRPPFQANTWMLWLAPLLFMGCAAGCAVLLLRRRADTRAGRRG